MAESAKEARSAVQAYYPNLLKLLPIDKLVERFFSRKLLSFDQKSELDSITSRKEKTGHFLDAILIPGLEIEHTEHFDEMIIMMKESDNVLVKWLVEKLIPDVSAAPVIHDSRATLPTDAGTGRLSIVAVVLVTYCG